MSARAPIVLALALIAFALGGCGERPQVTVYKQGTYKGKPDNLPWQSPPFAGSKVDWDKAMNARVAKQNEYARIENQ